MPLNVSIAKYSGDNTLGTQANPGVSPFGCHFLAGVDGVPAATLVGKSYGALWDFGDASATQVTRGKRAQDAGTAVSGNTYKSALIDSHVFEVPDGAGLTEFVVRVGVSDGTDEGFAEFSVWVQDQATYHGAANTICVSNSLALNESAFVVAGAPAGATYQANVPGAFEMAGKRILFYGQDTFPTRLDLGIGEDNISVGTFGAGRPELAGDIRTAVNSNGQQSLNFSSSTIRNADTVNGWGVNHRISGIKTPKISMGAVCNQLVLKDIDADYSSLTAPNRNAGTIGLGASDVQVYNDPANLSPANVPYSSGVYIDDAVIKGPSVKSIKSGSSDRTGNVFDVLDFGSTVTSIDYDGINYAPGSTITVGTTGTLTISTNGDFSWTVATFDKNTNEAITINTDGGSETVYTGHTRPVLNISGIYAYIFGFSVTNTEMRYANEHNIRFMGAGLSVVRDVEGGEESDLFLKHFYSVRCIDLPTATNVPPEIPANGPNLPFGSDGIKVWGGSPRLEQPADTLRPIPKSEFHILEHADADMKIGFDGDPSGAYSRNLQTGVTSLTHPNDHERYGMNAVLFYNIRTNTEDSSNAFAITGGGDGTGTNITHVGVTQLNNGVLQDPAVVYDSDSDENLNGDIPAPASLPAVSGGGGEVDPPAANPGLSFSELYSAAGVLYSGSMTAKIYSDFDADAVLASGISVTVTDGDGVLDSDLVGSVNDNVDAYLELPDGKNMLLRSLTVTDLGA